MRLFCVGASLESINYKPLDYAALFNEWQMPTLTVRTRTRTTSGICISWWMGASDERGRCWRSRCRGKHFKITTSTH